MKQANIDPWRVWLSCKGYRLVVWFRPEWEWPNKRRVNRALVYFSVGFMRGNLFYPWKRNENQ